MATPYVGEIRMFAGNFAPTGWALCAGQLLSISQNTTLFAVIGTTYGGDGVTSFGLPDLQGRTPLHWGTGLGLSTYQIGQKAGVEATTLLMNNMPTHTHQVNADSAAGTVTTPQNNVLAAVSAGTTEKLYSATTTPDTTMSGSMINTTGQNLPFEIMEPYLCITFIIALQGVFPSQN